MTHQERDRLAISLALALLIHAGIVLLIIQTDWSIDDYVEPKAFFVQLPEYVSAPPVPEPAPEIDDPIPEPIDPEPADPQPIDTEPIEPQPAEPVTATQNETQPAVQETAPPGRDAPEGSFSIDDDPMLRSDRVVDRTAGRADDAELFNFDETTESGTLPVWVVEGLVIQPLESLAQADQETLAEKEDTIPGFEEYLDSVLESINTESTAGTSTGSESGTDPGPGSTTEPGESNVVWIGGATRSSVGNLLLPDLVASDFGGLVPTLTYVIVFEVNADGLVVPGSLILRNGSGYTAADQKVRRAVSSWRFEPAPGSLPVTAIYTLPLEPDN